MPEHIWIEVDVEDKHKEVFMDKFKCHNEGCSCTRYFSMDEIYMWFDSLGNLYANYPPPCRGKFISADEMQEGEYYWIKCFGETHFAQFIKFKDGYFHFIDDDNKSKQELELIELESIKRV